MVCRSILDPNGVHIATSYEYDRSRCPRLAFRIVSSQVNPWEDKLDRTVQVFQPYEKQEIILMFS